jgi:hypothetical protein
MFKKFLIICCMCQCISACDDSSLHSLDSPRYDAAELEVSPHSARHTPKGWLTPAEPCLTVPNNSPQLTARQMPPVNRFACLANFGLSALAIETFHRPVIIRTEHMMPLLDQAFTTPASRQFYIITPVGARHANKDVQAVLYRLQSFTKLGLNNLTTSDCPNYQLALDIAANVLCLKKCNAPKKHCCDCC